MTENNIYMSHITRNLSLGFFTRSDTNWAVQPQNMAKRLVIWDLGRRGLVPFV